MVSCDFVPSTRDDMLVTHTHLHTHICMHTPYTHTIHTHTHTRAHTHTPQDLIALKSLENYNLVECEELQGSNVSTFGDDFTVATALEDLEFGFSIITSAQ